MVHDPIIAIRDVLAEIELPHGIAGRMTLTSFKADPIAKHAAAYAIQIISEAGRQIPDAWLADHPTELGLRSRASATEFAKSISGSTTRSSGRSSRKTAMPSKR
jgi:hypothetical protein